MISDAFVLDDFPWGGVRKATDILPGVDWTHYFSERLGPKDYLCGPALRRKQGGKVTDLGVTVVEEGFAFRRQTDGTLLIKSGPYTFLSRFGTGPCGRCPLGAIEIYTLHTDGKLVRSLRIAEAINGGDDFDIQVSHDLSHVDVFLSRDEVSFLHPPEWQDTFYCLQGDKYLTCGTGTKPPPVPRTLNFKHP